MTLAMTVPQLMAVVMEKPPGGPQPLTTREEYDAALGRKRRADSEWEG